MIEDFVSYDQAIKLKKLGFNIDCDYMYSEDKELYKYDYTAKYYDTQSLNNDVPAPTLAQAQKWLRKEKEYSIEPTSISKNLWICTLTIFNKSTSLDIKTNYSSYEEALSSGITKCIKLLEN